MSVFDKVKEIIAQELNVDAETIALESNLKDDLGADSIDAVQIIMELEALDKNGNNTITTNLTQN